MASLPIPGTGTSMAADPSLMRQMKIGATRAWYATLADQSSTLVAETEVANDSPLPVTKIVVEAHAYDDGAPVRTVSTMCGMSVSQRLIGRLTREDLAALLDLAPPAPLPVAPGRNHSLSAGFSRPERRRRRSRVQDCFGGAFSRSSPAPPSSRGVTSISSGCLSERRKLRMPRPKPSPISGSFPAPNMMRMITRMISSSDDTESEHALPLRKGRPRFATDDSPKPAVGANTRPFSAACPVATLPAQDRGGGRPGSRRGGRGGSCVGAGLHLGRIVLGLGGDRAASRR